MIEWCKQVPPTGIILNISLCIGIAAAKFNISCSNANTDEVVDDALPLCRLRIVASYWSVKESMILLAMIESPSSKCLAVVSV